MTLPQSFPPDPSLQKPPSSVTPSPKILSSRRQMSTPTALNYPKQTSLPPSRPLVKDSNNATNNTTINTATNLNNNTNNYPIKVTDTEANIESTLTDKNSEPYILAIQEFDRMMDYTDVYDKLNCLILVRHYIQDSIIAYWKKKDNLIKRI